MITREGLVMSGEYYGSGMAKNEAGTIFTNNQAINKRIRIMRGEEILYDIIVLAATFTTLYDNGNNLSVRVHDGVSIRLDSVYYSGDTLCGVSGVVFQPRQ